MADNYLEKRFEEVFGSGRKPSGRHFPKKDYQSLDTLLHKNRSHRSFDPERVPSEEELRKIVEVNTFIPSAMNQQALRFRTVSDPVEAGTVLSNIKMGGALPELHLPVPGTEPPSYIIVMSSKEENKFVDIDLGISLQSMALRAVDLGYNALMVCSFNPDKLKEDLHLPYRPLAVLCIGKGKDSIFLMPCDEGDSLKYYRKEGVHYVPKIKLEDLLV